MIWPSILFFSAAFGFPFSATSPLQITTHSGSSTQNPVDVGGKINADQTRNFADNDATPLNKIIYARQYGFSPSASASVNTKAAQKISTLINSTSGGVTLLIEEGTYVIGKESFAAARTKGYSYLGELLFTFKNCTKPIIIEGSGATIKLSNGLHFGSFDPVKDAVYNPPPGDFTDYNYAAYPNSIIDARNNSSVTVRNLSFDGNVQNMRIGGRWNDDGIQLPADALLFLDNHEILVENVKARYFGRDGIMIGNTTTTSSSPIKRATILNSVFNGNARQGLSFIGGNHLYVKNTQFINTGRTINNNSKKQVRSSPAAGVDLEAELGLIRNLVFEDCIIDNNDGSGLLTVGDVADVKWTRGKIIGATNWSIYGSGPRTVFENVTIVGSPVNLHYAGKTFDPGHTKFINCLISADSTLSPTKKVHGNYVMDFGGGAGGHFINCIIDYANRGSVYGGDLIFENCTFKRNMPVGQQYNGYSFLTGTFMGVNKYTSTVYPDKTPPPHPNKKNSKFLGPFLVNGFDISGL